MIGTLIALGCIFAAVAVVLGIIFMPRTVAFLFGFHIALPYFIILGELMGPDYSGFLLPVVIGFPLIFITVVINEIRDIKKEYFTK